MTLNRRTKDQNIRRLRRGLAIIVAGTNTVVHRRCVATRNTGAARAVAVIGAATRGIRTDHGNPHDVNGHQVDRAKAVTSATNIRMKEVIREVIATNTVTIEC